MSLHLKRRRLATTRLWSPETFVEGARARALYVWMDGGIYMCVHGQVMNEETERNIPHKHAHNQSIYRSIAVSIAITIIVSECHPPTRKVDRQAGEYESTRMQTRSGHRVRTIPVDRVLR